MEEDFGYGQNTNSVETDSDVKGNDTNVTDIDTGKIDHDSNGESVDSIDDSSKSVEETTSVETDKEKTVDKNNKDDSDSDKTSTKELQPGTTIEVDSDKYTIDEQGNVIDSNGNIYKEASEVQEWLKSFDEVKDNEQGDGITIDAVKDAVGISITDDKDNPIEFDNSVEGIKSYIDAVIETSKEEHFETAINTLYQKYPILQDVLNYYVANGNSLEGYGELPDRSNVTIDDNNEQQQEAIIRAAWSERKQKGDIDGYINYLKSSGTLLATAQQELEALQESDKQYREELEKEAERKENERIETLEKYWNGVHDVIKTRNIAGYQIPESIIINRNGQKFSVTPEDFFNYIYRVDKDGKSAYERDLAIETPESRRDDEILRAYLKFVGGNYSNLVSMAINKEKVNNLKFRAKQRTKSSIRINRPQNTTNNKDIDLGYN